MEFGKLPDVTNVNWKIPEDDPLNAKFLSQPIPSKKMQIFFGAPAWGHSTWLGKIYPHGTKRSEFLHFYSRYFSCIELNSSHYAIPDPNKVKIWISQVPQNFRFCPKIHQGISHRRRGLLDRGLHTEWFNFLKELDDRCGPSFLQLPPYFDYAMKGELFNFLKNWPAEFQLALEFRHPSWFHDGKILVPLAEYLNRRKMGVVITDVAGRRDVLHTSLTTDFSLIRFIGNDLHPSDFERAQNWCQKFLDWEVKGLKTLFLFIHEPDDILAPEMTEFFLRKLSERSWNLKSPEPAAAQLRLNI